MRHIVYLHGFASGAQSTKAVWLAGRLKPFGVPLHAPDFNQPDFRTLTVTRMLEDVERVIAPLEGPVTLMGSSLGALVAYHAAVKNPRVDRLVLLAPALDIGPSLRRGLGDGRFEQWREQGWLEIDHYGFKETRRIDYTFFEDASRYDPFSTPLDLPILIFQGRRDEAVSPAMVERFALPRPNVELHMLDDDHQLISSLEYIWERSAGFLDVPGPRSSRRIFLLSFVLFVFVVASSSVPLVAQEVSDADLEAAGSGRTIRIRASTNGAARVADIPLEVYVARVLAGEGEPRAADAAQQALAIAVRTFAAANASRHGREGFDLCDTTHCQVLRASTPASRRAALATAGRLLTFDGRPAEVFYSASCGGRSELASEVWPGAADHPYLDSVDDDVHAGEAPWVVDLPASRVEQALRKAGFEGGKLKDLRIERRSESGRVTRLALAGMRPGVIAGDDFRLAVGARELRSTAFTVKKAGGAFRFTGRGYGHGVGLCVIGAGIRAARGEDATQILERYYPGASLTELKFGATAGTELTFGAAGSRADSGTAAAPNLSSAMTPNVSAALAASGIVVRVPPGAGVDQSAVARVVQRARHELANALGLPAAAAVTLEIHQSLDSFRLSTGRPWWVSTVVTGAVVDLAPVPLLMQRDGLEPAIRRGVAERLVSETLAGRPAWVRTGAAAYFARAGAPSPNARREALRAPPRGKVRCPSDAELTMSVSAPAQREAEERAEACFAKALAKTGDWRAVR